MIRLTCRMLLVFGLLTVLFSSGESTAQSMKKRAGPTVDLDGFKSQVFDYWKAPDAKEKLEKPILSKFTLPKGKEYPSDGEIIVKELSTTDGPKEVFEEMKKLMKPGDGEKIEELSTENELKKDGPKITELVIRKGTFAGDAKGKEVKDARLVVAVVETKDKKYMVRMVGPRMMLAVAQADLEQFLKDFKK